MDYPCTGCGECCKGIQAALDASHGHPVIQELVRRFPYKTRDDGSCEMLTSDLKCSVYDTRPLLCNIKLGGKLLKLDEREWFKLNQDGCNALVKLAELGDEYLVSLDF